MKYLHIDVFSDKPMHGNALAAVFTDRETDSSLMLGITQEFNQFETVFIYPPDEDNSYRLRIFTREEELRFAGHPVMGACAAIHREYFSSLTHTYVNFRLGERTVRAESEKLGAHYHVKMNQGFPEYIKTVKESLRAEIASFLSLSENDISDSFQAEVISTGLPYLLVPLKSGIERARIANEDFGSFLEKQKAKFVYVFDINTLECRSWDNAGRHEDTATASAAGPLCAWLVKNRIRDAGEVITLKQGKFTGRSSQMKCLYDIVGNEITVTGDVSFFAEGNIL